MIPAIGNFSTRLDTSRIDPTSSMMTSTAGETTGASAQGFAAAMADVAKEATQTLKSAETTSIQGINGQASTQAVVDAVMGAERTLQTAIAIRDKVVSAYLELSRMSI